MRRMLALFCVLIGIFILIVPSLNFGHRDYRFNSEREINLEAPVPPIAPAPPEGEFRPHRPYRGEYGREMRHDHHGAGWFIVSLIGSFIMVFTLGGMIAVSYMLYLKWKATQNPIHYV